MKKNSTTDSILQFLSANGPASVGTIRDALPKISPASVGVTLYSLKRRGVVKHKNTLYSIASRVARPAPPPTPAPAPAPETTVPETKTTSELAFDLVKEYNGMVRRYNDALVVIRYLEDKIEAINAFHANKER